MRQRPADRRLPLDPRRAPQHRPMPLAAAALAALLSTNTSLAQTAPAPAPTTGNATDGAPAATPAAAPTPAGAASAPARAPAARSAPSSTPAAAQLERVEILGGGSADTETRRQSTAAKIVIGREEIDRHGDANVAEVLKRLPGVTLGGNPGRGSDIRMRGLGSGYTQILINGERMPPGLQLDALSPEQIERIEVMRSPTAETGARAIAGTINIVLREDVRKRLNNVQLTAALENGRIDPSASWTRAEALGAFSYNLSGTVNHRYSDDEIRNLTVTEGSTPRRIEGLNTSHDERTGVHLGGRLQWRLDPGETLALMPFVVLSKGHNQSQADRQATLGAQDASDYTHYDANSHSSFAMARWNGQWQKRLTSGDRVELKAGSSWARYRNESHRLSTLVAPDAAGSPTQQIDGSVNNQDRYWTLSGKYSRLLPNEHSLSLGGELDHGQRRDRQLTYENGTQALSEFGGDIVARTQRTAAWIQDDWAFSPTWSAYAGLRWEGIETRSDYGADSSLSPVRNQSQVWTPLLHSVWKLDEKGRDQIRASLTRSYRSPTLQNLVARPTLSRAANDATTPDRAGNAELKPELATGIDLAFEHYLEGGGLLSVNLFHRQIRDLIRNTTLLETVSWSSDPRWVSRPRNVGPATSSGIELESKLRLDEWLADAPRVNLRANLSLFVSRVASVPGPDNRLDNQPGAAGNLGADYRLRGLPLQIGGNLNWTPATHIQLSDTQRSTSSVKRAVDAFAAWSFDPNTTLRLSVSNLLAQDGVSSTAIVTPTGEDTATNASRTYRSVSLRLEMKL